MRPKPLKLGEKTSIGTMPSRKKRPTAQKTNGKHTATGLSSNLNKPRLDPIQRQLNRFYEPLVFLYTMGQTRGEHTGDRYAGKIDVTASDAKGLRRTFLSELAYACDYDKGGNTVTAIGLQSTPEHPVYWVASNSCPLKKIVPFLKELLHQLGKAAESSSAEGIDKCCDEITRSCIKFSTPRVRKYRSLLSKQVSHCLAYISKSATKLPVQRDLATWLQLLQKSIGKEWDPFSLCQFAYHSRKTTHLKLIAELDVEPMYKSSQDAPHHSFRLLRHYIGRLGHPFAASKTLVSIASRFVSVLDDFRVCGIATPDRSTSPPTIDGLTRLDSVLKRMLPMGSPQLEPLTHAIADMDQKTGLQARFLQNYTHTGFLPRVHAEIQVLEHFYKNNLIFEGGDRHVACSKASCYCCKLYFRYHPGNFVEPESHEKIYLSWRPPDDLTRGPHELDRKRQRDILNQMVCVIRKDALAQIGGMKSQCSWHPDSLTGITFSSAKHEEPIPESTESYDNGVATSSCPDNSCASGSNYPDSDHPRNSNQSPDSLAERLPPPSISDIENTDKSSPVFHSVSAGIEIAPSDSDSDGGVAL